MLSLSKSDNPVTGGSQQLKFGETYAKSVKTGQSGLGNRTIRFGKPDHSVLSIKPQKLRHPVFPVSTY
jgi:hypothetical protein